MSRPKLLPPLAPETQLALGEHSKDESGIAPRHEIGAEADPRLLGLVKNLAISEGHLREMHEAMNAGTLEVYGTHVGKPLQGAARWAKRNLDALTAIIRVATEVNDTAFPLHMEAIQRGRKNPPFPLRMRVWLGWIWCSTVNRPKRDYTESEMWDFLENGWRQNDPYIPSAGEIAEWVSDGEETITARDCTNHLKALSLPYAPARRGKKSI